jgi:DNA-directed RNA polymerase subunit beta'
MITTVGKEMVRDALPSDYRQYADKPIDGKVISNLTTELARKNPSLYIDTIQKLNNIGRNVAYTYGRDASISLKDLTVPASIKKKRQELKDRIHVIVNSSGMTPDQKLDEIVKVSNKAGKNMSDQIYKELLARNNSMARQIESGSRGNKTQLMQTVFGDMMMVDGKDRLIPFPGLDDYGGGAKPLTYWIGAQSGRKGAIGTQFATADAGYFAKQVSNVGHRNIVTMEDCGVTNGLRVSGDDPDNVGSILLADAGPLKAGTIITADHLPVLAKYDITVRSPITCKAGEGVCQKCSGIREKGTFPDIGEAVGINAVRSFTEAITQGGLGSKHIGGIGGKEPVGLTGFKEVNQFVQVPKEFVGGAVLAEADGKVAKIQNAPQGGKYMMISGKQYHIPRELATKVKVGDTVEAGDVLSDGVPNPSQIVKYKGIGEGRKYFLEQFRDILDRNNGGTNRRNLELFARSFISKVKVTEPKGYNGHMIDDVVDYDYIASRWEPREGSQLKSVTSASNLYLEQPYLHYSIGTRITPKVAKKLRDNGIKDVMTHKNPPPFEPYVVRAQDFIQTDKDWITRLGGENLKKATIAGATRGASSEIKGTSYYPRLAMIGEN